MIHPNDLRIGNYVSVDNKNISIVKGLLNDMVVSIDDGTRFYSKYFGYKEIEGILLTEEILLKLGFAKYGHLTRWFLSFQGRMYDIFKDGGRWYLLSHIKDHEVKLNQNEMFYVHQLQNFYYSLTGKELTFKE